jgi:hypothetical protein
MFLRHKNSSHAFLITSLTKVIFLLLTLHQANKCSFLGYRPIRTALQFYLIGILALG